MESEYKTTDIILAACLVLHGYEMTAIEKDGNRGTFVFKNVKHEYIGKYDLGLITVEPVTFNNTIKRLTTSVRRV